MKKTTKRKWIVAAVLLALAAAPLAGCEGQTAQQKESKEQAGQDGKAEESGETVYDQKLIAMAQQGFETEIDCEPIELSLGCSGTVDGTARGDAIYAAIEAAKEWTDGKFTVNFYPGGQLGEDSDLIKGVQLGSIDLFTGSSTAQSGLIRELSVLDICGLYADLDSANEVLAEFQETLQPYYQDAGLALLSMYAPDFRILTSDRPVRTAADLSGLKIRTQDNPYQMAFWRALGADPDALAFGELYMALSQGELNAQENSWDTIAGAGLAKVQGYAVETNHIPFIITFVMNRERYDEMSEGQKLACSQFITFCLRYHLAAAKEDDVRLAKLCETEYGMETVPVSGEIRAMYGAAAESVIGLLKESLDPELVDRYVRAAKKGAGSGQ